MFTGRVPAAADAGVRFTDGGGVKSNGHDTVEIFTAPVGKPRGVDITAPDPSRRPGAIWAARRWD